MSSNFQGDGGELSQRAITSIEKSYAVDDLPTTAPTGTRTFVTDANAATFNTTAASGGSNKVPVFFNGSVWKIG